MSAFQFIKIPERSTKPRKVGLTSIIDKGLDIERIQQQISLGKDIIDIIKLGFGTARLYPDHLLKEKITALRDANIKVCPGGTLFEIAYVQNVVPEFFKVCKRLHFDCIEISDGSIPMKTHEKLTFIDLAKKQGFTVISEVGYKDPQQDSQLSIAERIIEIKKHIEAGVWKVIVEGRESGNVGLFSHDTSVKENDFDHMLTLINPSNLIFEAPHKHQQVWFIEKLGNNVNLGNILLHDIYALEALRLGLRGDTLLQFHKTRAKVK